jgi:hypothetical protein
VDWFKEISLHFSGQTDENHKEFQARVAAIHTDILTTTPQKTYGILVANICGVYDKNLYIYIYIKTYEYILFDIFMLVTIWTVFYILWQSERFKQILWVKRCI